MKLKPNAAVFAAATIASITSVSVAGAASKVQESIITGIVKLADSKCKSDDLYVFLSYRSELFYQVAAKPNGSFEFHVRPGRYEITAASKDGCYDEFRVDARRTSNVTVNLKPFDQFARAQKPQQAGRAPAQVAVTPPPTQSGGGFDPQLAQTYARIQRDCPRCYEQLIRGEPITPPRYRQPFSEPWVVPLGQYGFMSYGMPAAWYGMGVNPYYYPTPYFGPSNGGFHAGKPNVYVYGPAGTKVDVRVKTNSQSQILATVPAHGSTGWSATLTDKGTLATKDSEFPYFYLDFNFDALKTQTKSGFCVDKTNVIDAMTEKLALAGFSKRECDDFREYWSYKMPPAEEYCIYPQMNEVLDAQAKLEITPKPAQVTRMTFLVIPQIPGKRWPIAKFNARPVESFNYRAATRAPASSEGVVVREWGVGFLGNPPKDTPRVFPQ